MCRNIRTLANFAPPATAAEIRASSLQFVRKLSGANMPSKANEALWDRAVIEVAAAAERLVHGWVTAAPPKDRGVEIRKMMEQSRRRFGKEPGARPSTRFARVTGPGRAHPRAGLQPFTGSSAYFSLLESRFADLREDKIEHVLSLSRFVTRRVRPAADTYRSLLERLAKLSERIARAADLLGRASSSMSRSRTRACSRAWIARRGSS
jgi:hypothetical protein